MESTLTRIKQYIDYKGLSVRKFEESVGLSNGSFASQYKNGKTIGVDKVKNILRIYDDLSAEWLLTGHGSMIKESSEKCSGSIAKQVGIEKPLSSKAGRHTYATIFLRKTKDLSTLKDILGHSDYRETLIYAHVMEDSKIDGARDSFNSFSL